MKKTELHDLVLETVNEYVNEADLATGDNNFTIKVAVNKNPTKEGIKIQLVPKAGTVLEPDERIDVNEKIQRVMNQKLAQYDLQVNIDPDVKQTDLGPDGLSYYIPINQFKNLITKALKGKEDE
jgi:hypothetical protein